MDTLQPVGTDLMSAPTGEQKRRLLVPNAEATNTKEHPYTSNRNRLSRSTLSSKLTELKLMARAAIMGLIKGPPNR